MAWSKINEVSPRIGRPVLVHTIENDRPLVAFLSSEGVWYEGGALMQAEVEKLAA